MYGGVVMDKPPAGAPPFKGRVKAYRELMESLWYASELFKNEGDGGIEGARRSGLNAVRIKRAL